MGVFVICKRMQTNQSRMSQRRTAFCGFLPHASNHVKNDNAKSHDGKDRIYMASFIGSLTSVAIMIIFLYKCLDIAGQRNWLSFNVSLPPPPIYIYTQEDDTLTSQQISPFSDSSQHFSTLARLATV